MIFVDPNSGDDTLGNGTNSNPFKTITRAMNYIWQSNEDKKLDKTQPTAIILGDGLYNWDDKLNSPQKIDNAYYSNKSNQYNYLSTNFGYGSCNSNINFADMNISFIPKHLGSVTITSTINGYEFLTCELRSITEEIFKFYGVIFTCNANTQPKDICNHIHLDGDSRPNEFYNCVFDRVSLGGLDKFQRNLPTVLMQNCVFKDCEVYYKEKPIKKGVVINCASNNGYIEPEAVTHTTCLDTTSIDNKYNIIDSSWEHAGTSSVTFEGNTYDNKNPDGTDANIGVYGGAYSWPCCTILNIETPTTTYDKHENFTADLTIQNVTEISAEDIEIKYDPNKLEFVDMKEVDGIHLVHNDVNNGTIRVILASNSRDNIITKKTTLLKLNFKTIESGETTINVSNGKLTDGISSEYSLTKKQLGSDTLNISENDLQDVNKDGSFTLLDLGIDARHEGESPEDLPQYNADINKDSSINLDDLYTIIKNILLNNNYKF